MKQPASSKQLLNKRIPTLLGIFVLVIALVAGTLLIGDGPGVFAPRATPSTTPKNIKVTNVTDNSFTISFLTDEAVPGFVKYGTTTGELSSQAGDDRDQLSGTVGDFQTHHITIRGLQPSTNYYYTLGTGSSATFDNNGTPFSLKTTARSGAPAAAKTVYGSVSTQTGNPADGAIVYISLQNAGQMSALVKASGGWAIPLSNARTPDGSGYAQISDTDQLTLLVQGITPNDTVAHTTTVSQAQPIPTLNLGTTSGQTTPMADTTVVPVVSTQKKMDEEELITDIPATESAQLSDTLLETTGLGTESSRSAAISRQTQQDTETEIDDITILDLELTQEQTVTTTQPKIVGKAIPNAIISIEVHSETQISQQITANESGEFELDIAELSKNLEPGPHTVTYSYTDPETGEAITKTVNFMVADTTQQLAQNQPFGSGNPYPPATPTPTPTPTPAVATQSATATASATATQSATATDSGRTSMPATNSAIPVSGSVGTTLALVFGGLFFIVSGLWSFLISHQLAKQEVV